MLALFIRTFVVQAFKIPTGSMEPNLLIGDHLLVNKFVFGPSLERRRAHAAADEGDRPRDVIVFKYPEDPERDFIKRVIGLPGEQIEVRHKRVYVNGTPARRAVRPLSGGAPARPAGNGAGGDRQGSSGDPRENYGPVTVPPKHYFVMGDNRDNSQDSRYWGFLPRDYVKGQGSRHLLVVRGRDRKRRDRHPLGTPAAPGALSGP